MTLKTELRGPTSHACTGLRGHTWSVAAPLDRAVLDSQRTLPVHQARHFCPFTSHQGACPSFTSMWCPEGSQQEGERMEFWCSPACLPFLHPLCTADTMWRAGLGRGRGVLFPGVEHQCHHLAFLSPQMSWPGHLPNSVCSGHVGSVLTPSDQTTPKKAAPPPTHDSLWRQVETEAEG